MARQVEARQDLWTKRECRGDEGQSHQPDTEDAGDERAVQTKGTATW